MEGLVPRFELDTPRDNSEAPIGLIKKTSTTLTESGPTAVTVMLAIGHGGMGTELMGTILTFVSVPLRKMGILLLGSWWP